jgi:hypothetical protein
VSVEHPFWLALAAGGDGAVPHWVDADITPARGGSLLSRVRLFTDVRAGEGFTGLVMFATSS